MKSLTSNAVGSGPLQAERRRRKARHEIFTTPKLVTARRSILGLPARAYCNKCLFIQKAVQCRKTHMPRNRLDLLEQIWCHLLRQSRNDVPGQIHETTFRRLSQHPKLGLLLANADRFSIATGAQTFLTSRHFDPLLKKGERALLNNGKHTLWDTVTCSLALIQICYVWIILKKYLLLVYHVGEFTNSIYAAKFLIDTHICFLYIPSNIMMMIRRRRGLNKIGVLVEIAYLEVIC